MPIRGIFAGCCARSASGQVAPALPSRAIKSRRLTSPPVNGRRLAPPTPKLRQNARPAHLAMSDQSAPPANRPAALRCGDNVDRSGFRHWDRSESFWIRQTRQRFRTASGVRFGLSFGPSNPDVHNHRSDYGWRRVGEGEMRGAQSTWETRGRLTALRNRAGGPPTWW